MKKLTLGLLAFFLFLPLAYAGECEIITDVDDYWVEVVSGVNIRDEVCDGNVIGTLSSGTKVKVIGHIEGWRYIERPEGGNGFVWSDFVDETNAPVIEPEEIVEEEEVEPEETVEEEEVEVLFDVDGHENETAIRYLGDKDIVQGYPDGSYKPGNSVNRAEFTKIIVGAKLGEEPSDFAGNCFPDVSESDWFSSYVCYAKENGIITGYPNGTFQPANTINLAEAAKIVVNTLGVQLSDDDSGHWYAVFIRSLQSLSFIPDTFGTVSDLVDRGQMAELIYRIMEDENDKPSTTFPETSLSNSSGVELACADEEIPSNVDIDVVRAEWFKWVNEARAGEGKNAYAQSLILDATAQAWSDYSANKGVMSHTRPGQTEYYDYSLITSWFEDLGVTFKNVGGWTYSENIGRSYYTCSSGDCTQDVIDGSKLIFDAYMAEKGTSYTAHYDSVMGAFNQMGAAWTFKGNDIYITIHYAAEIDKSPVLTCQ